VHLAGRQFDRRVPAECSGIRDVHAGEAHKLGLIRDQHRSQSEHHELGWVVADVDNHPFGAGGSIDVTRDVGDLYRGQLQIGDLVGEHLEGLAGPVVDISQQSRDRYSYGLEFERFVPAAEPHRGFSAIPARHLPRDVPQNRGFIGGGVIRLPGFHQLRDGRPIEIGDHIADLQACRGRVEGCVRRDHGLVPDKAHVHWELTGASRWPNLERAP
jgi:hypothetical protein